MQTNPAVEQNKSRIGYEWRCPFSSAGFQCSTQLKHVTTLW